MSSTSEDGLKDIHDGDNPLYISAIIGFVKVLFFLYDLVVYIPIKLFDDPAKKLEKSRKLKARPEKDPDDPAKAWRNIRSMKQLKEVTFEGCDTIAKQWDECVRRYGDLPSMGTREVLKVHKEKQPNGKIFEKWEMGEYHWRSYNEINERVGMVASGLKAIGHPEEGPIVLFAETREEWMITALACFKRAYPIATVYATLGEEAVLFAFKEVAAATIFTSESLLLKVRKAMQQGARIKNIIYFDSVDPGKKGESIESDDPYTLMSFEQLLRRGEESPLPKVESIAKPNDIAFIMYTSGTTGNPKGVLLTHKNVIGAQAGQADCIPFSAGDTYIGYLPLAHILEVCGELICFVKGVKIGYSSAQTLFDRAPKILKGHKGDCFVLKPTLMTCVPAVMDRIYKAVVDEVNSQNRLFRELFRTCYERKRNRYEEGYNSYLLNYLVFNKIRVMLGGEVRAVLSGGAPLNPETQRFMNICFCCPVVQGYGLTETCGGGTCAEVEDISTGYVGAPLSSCVIMLREWKEGGYSPYNQRPQGEILISGSNVTQGYYKNPEKTKEEFIELDGRRWFCTGDIGEFREDGALKIIDRKKDLLKLSHGEYISLGKVETNLLTNPNVDNICVYGDSDKSYVVALVVANQKNVTAMAENLGVDTSNFEKLCKDKKVNGALLKELQHHANGKLERVEIPQKIHIIHEPWTPASGLLTEALKLKRKNIEQAYKKELKEMYK